MGNSAQTIAPTSGTTEFDPQMDDIIEEAYERTGVLGTRTGYQLRSARRSLNILFQEWGNRGVHLWKVKLAKVPFSKVKLNIVMQLIQLIFQMI